MYNKDDNFHKQQKEREIMKNKLKENHKTFKKYGLSLEA